MTRSRRRLGRLAGALVLLGWVAAGEPAVGAERLDLRHVAIELPGAPIAVVPADLDGDGVRELAVAVAVTDWRQLAVSETTTMDDVEGLVEVMTVVPYLEDRRELWLLREAADGGYEPAAPPLALPLSVLSLGAGPAARPLLALTDEGVAEVVWEAASLALRPLVADPPVMAGSGSFVPGLVVTAELSGDGWPELLLPAPDGLAILPGTAEGFAPAASRLAPPGDETGPARAASSPLADEDDAATTCTLAGCDGRSWVTRRLYPLPEVRDVDGDGRADLLFRHPVAGWQQPSVVRNLGGLRFAAPLALGLPEAPDGGEHEADAVDGGESVSASHEWVYVGDLAGDGRAEIATLESHHLPDDAGMRAELRDAEAPKTTLRVVALGDDLRPAGEPVATVPLVGHAFGDGDTEMPGGFVDLDGDGDQDLVTAVFELSVVKLLAGVARGRVTLPMQFEVWCQEPAGRFVPVPGLDLSGRLRVRLDAFELRQMPLFAGDFDGDGRRDYVQLGDEKKLGIHRGGPGCTYPARPDAVIRLEEAPRALELVSVSDLDGDGRSDVQVVSPGAAGEDGESPRVRLDLYLSGGGAAVRR